MATADVLVVSSAVPFPNDASVQTVKTTGSSKQKSLDVDIPQWIKNDLYIVRGYRPQLHSFRACMGSLFYLHNEFVSTWSHLLPAFAFIWMLATDSWLESSPKDTVIASKDLVPVQVYIICTAACLLLSVCHAIGSMDSTLAPPVYPKPLFSPEDKLTCFFLGNFPLLVLAL